MSLSEDQLKVLRCIPGFHLNSGEPCTCGPHLLATRKKVGYSDFVTYYHRCKECGNKFSTYIEG